METNIQVDSYIMCDNDNEIDACDDNGDIKSGLSHNVFDDEDLYYQSLPNDMFSIRPIQDEMNDKYMIFSGAIRLDTAITYNMELLTAVTVFNLALVFHVEGLKVIDDTNPMNNVGITKALRLYNQASILLSSLHKEDDDDEEECYDVLLAIMLAAILTNTAQIHYDCYRDMTQSKQILQKLKSIPTWMEIEFVTYGMIPLQDYEVFISVIQQMNEHDTYFDFHFCAAVA